MSNDFKYISVIFENTYYPFNHPKIQKSKRFRNDVYGKSTQYTYKIKEGQVQNLAEGRIIPIIINHKVSRVLVTKTNLNESDISFPIDKIKELPVYTPPIHEEEYYDSKYSI